MKPLLLVAAMSMALVAPVWAKGPQLFPVKAVIGLKDGASGSQLITPEFSQAINGEAPAMGQFFANELKTAFPAWYTDTLGQSNRGSTFAVSLQLTRASHYTVPRIDGTVTHYLPVTVALMFTNPLTGEVLFTHAVTRYQLLTKSASASADEVAAEVAASYRNNLKTLIREVVQESAKDFKPFEIKTRVKDDWNGLYVMDKGLDGGVVKGDLLSEPSGQLLEVLHASAGYAIARTVLGNGKVKGIDFIKFSNMSLKDLKKPRVLLVTSDKPAVLQASAEHLFGDFLGYKANFTLTPVNANFQQVQDLIDIEGNLSKEETKTNRALPELFLRLKSVEPVSYEIPTKSASVTGKHIEARVYGELIDGAGRVVFAATGRDVYDDQSVDGMTFDESAQREVRLKNAVNDLADEFIRGVQFKSLEFKVSAVNKDEVRIDDPYGVLSPNRIIRLYRPIDGGVLVPIYEATVMFREGHTAVAALSLPVANEVADVRPEEGDRVLVETAGASDTSLSPLVQCSASAPPSDAVLQDVPWIGYYQAASQVRQPFFADVGPLRQRVESVMRYAGFRPGSLKLPQKLTAETCLEPKAKISDLQRSCDERFCKQKFKLIAGYLKQAPAGKKPYALQAEVADENVPAAFADAYLRLRVQHKVEEFMNEAVKKLNAE